MSLSSVGTGRIAVIVDPGNTINESFYNNNGPPPARLSSGSWAATVRPRYHNALPGSAPGGQGARGAGQGQEPSSCILEKGAKLYRKPPHQPSSIVHELTVFPKQVNNLIKKFV